MSFRSTYRTACSVTSSIVAVYPCHSPWQFFPPWEAALDTACGQFWRACCHTCQLFHCNYWLDGSELRVSYHNPSCTMVLFGESRRCGCCSTIFINMFLLRHWLSSLILHNLLKNIPSPQFCSDWPHIINIIKSKWAY